MLGHMQFGKVYKGLWRGTLVAVKTMLLPSGMSGVEKREKMVGGCADYGAGIGSRMSGNR